MPEQAFHGVIQWLAQAAADLATNVGRWLDGLNRKRGDRRHGCFNFRWRIQPAFHPVRL